MWPSVSIGSGDSQWGRKECFQSVTCTPEALCHPRSSLPQMDQSRIKYQNSLRHSQFLQAFSPDFATWWGIRLSWALGIQNRVAIGAFSINTQSHAKADCAAMCLPHVQCYSVTLEVGSHSSGGIIAHTFDSVIQVGGERRDRSVMNSWQILVQLQPLLSWPSNYARGRKRRKEDRQSTLIKE